MFEAVLRTPPIAPKIDPEIALLIAMEQYNCDISKLVVAERLLSTIDDLSILRANFAKYGITKPVVEFANHNGMLTAAIPAVPSVESMRGNIDVAGATPALDGIAQAIKDSASRWLQAIKDHLIKYRKWYAGFLTFTIWLDSVVASILIGVTALVGGPVVSASIFLKYMLSITVKSWLIKKLNAAKSIPLAVKMSLDVPIPTTQVELDRYKIKVYDLFMSKAGFNINSMEVEGNEGAAKSEGKSLKELGYTTKSIQEIAELTKDASGAIKSLGTIVETKLTKMAESEAGRTEIGRKAITWLTGVITGAMRKAVGATTEGAATAKKLADAGKKALAEAKAMEDKKK